MCSSDLLSLTAVGLTAAVSNLSSQYHAMGRPAVIGQVLRRCLACFPLLFAAVAAVVVVLYDPISVYLLGDARTQLGLLLLLPCVLLTGVENLHKHYFYGTGSIRPPAAVRRSTEPYRRQKASSRPRTTASSQHSSRLRPASRPIHHTRGLNQWTVRARSSRA